MLTPWIDANSPTLLNDLGFLNTTIPVVFSHATYLTPQDAVLLRQTNQYVSVTPESESHYGHDSVSPFILDQVSLGIDTHFTFSADLITQARLWLQAVRLKFYREVLQNWNIPSRNPMSVEQAFILATRSGAQGLHRDDLGVVAEGAKADLVVFDGSSPNMLGLADPVAAVILHSNAGDIEHVLVDGEFCKQDFKIISPKSDYTSVTAGFLKSARRVQTILEETPVPPMEGAWPY